MVKLSLVLYEDTLAKAYNMEVELFYVNFFLYQKIILAAKLTFYDL